jgi:hypothetical protein
MNEPNGLNGPNGPNVHSETEHLEETEHSAETESDQLPPSFVSGLIGLTVQYHPTWNKRVYILGERHDKIGVCEGDKSVVDAYFFFFGLLQSTDKLIDVFLEEEYSPGSNFSEQLNKKQNTLEKYPNYLLEVRYRLAEIDCVTEKYGTGCARYRDHVRFHLTDIRDAKLPMIEYIDCIYWLGVLIIDSSLGKLSTKDRHRVPYYINRLNALGSEHKYNNIEKIKAGLTDIYKGTKIEKQLSKIPIKYQSVKDYLNAKLESSHDELAEVLKYSSILPKITESLSEHRIKFLDEWQIISDSMIKLMDLYLVSRMFRTFRNVPSQLSEEPRNIIVYAGDEHCATYREILSAMGFTTEFTAKQTSLEACLNIEDLEIDWI